MDKKSVKNNEILRVKTTLFYGESFCEKKGQPNPTKYTTLEYNTCDKIGEEKILNYKIHKIICKYVSNKYIASLKIIYKNRNDGKEITLLETPCDQNDLIESEPFELFEFEEIILVRVWIETNKRLLGFEIKTNKDRIKKFGYGNDNNLIKIDELENQNKIVIGFGVYACSELGVTGLFCYYIGKKLHSLALNSGMFYLRVKIKKKQIDVNVSKKNDEQMYTLKRVCELADVLFFEVASFVVDK